MELPEETFENLHGYDAVGETYSKSGALFRLKAMLTSRLSPIHEVVSG